MRGMTHKGNIAGLTQGHLKSLLSYDALTGEFRWVGQPDGLHKPLIGRVAGVVLKSGHRQITIDGKQYVASHLAWLFVTGSLPDGMLDHRDLDAGNDRFTNLRPATKQDNSANRHAYKGSRTGVKGVQFRDGRTRPWIAQIRVNNKLINLGSFSSKDEAAVAYINAAKSAFGEFARAA